MTAERDGCPERNQDDDACLWERGHLQDHLFPIRLTQAEWESYRDAVLRPRDTPAPSEPTLLVEDPPDRQPYSTGWTPSESTP